MASGIMTSASLAGTEHITDVEPISGAYNVQASISRVAGGGIRGPFNLFSTASITASSSITLSNYMTVLVATQTSTGNTVILPTPAIDGQRFRFSITQNITTLTVSSTTGSMNWAPNTGATQSSGSSFEFGYATVSNTWYKV